MTPRQAKQLVRDRLEALGLQYSRLTARTVDFSDLARCSRVVVTVHGWQPNPAWRDLQALASDNGFYIEA